MGTSLNGLTPAGTYPGLIKTGDNAPIDGTLKTLSDGNGNNLPMAVSTTAVNFTNQLQQSGVAVPTASQVAAKQDTLVSGTNIKTINGTTILGSGNIVTPSTNPSGVSGAIQFSNGSAFASDAANLFWDDTNNRLGVGTNAPSFPVDVVGEIRSTTQVSAGTTGTNGTFLLRRTTDGQGIGSFSTSANEVLITEFSGSGGRLVTGFGTTALKWLGSSSQPRIGVGFNGSILATAHIQGSGSTSATTSLLVQNSAGTQLFAVRDDGSLIFQSANQSISQPINNTLLFRTAGQNSYSINGNNFTLGAWSSVNPVNFFVTSAGGGNTNRIGVPLNIASGNSTGNGIGGDISLQYSAPGSSGTLENPLVTALFISGTNGNAGINTTTPNASAQLDITSTTRGFLPPRMTTTQKNAITSPAAGLVVYDSTTNKLCCYNGSTWNDLF